MAGANPTDFSYQGLVNWAKNSLVNNVDARHIGGEEVALSTPVSGQALMYNGSKFVNADLAGAVYGKLNNTQINPAYLPSSGAKFESSKIVGSGVYGNLFTTWNYKISQVGQGSIVIVIAHGITTANPPTVGSGHGRIYFRFAYPFRHFSPTRETGWWLPNHIRYIYLQEELRKGYLLLRPDGAEGASNNTNKWCSFVLIGDGA